MGRVKITYGSHWSERPLAVSTLIGRHWSCDILLHAEEVPLRWLEIRWLGGRWGWRALSREGDTLGAGDWLRPGWRSLTVSRKANRVLRLRAAAAVELVNGDAPQPYAVDLQSGQILVKQSLAEMLGNAGFHQWRTHTGEPLNDGVVLVIEGRPLRLHLPQRVQATSGSGISSILHVDTLLKLDAETLTGAIELGTFRVELSREIVRVLLPYAEARVNDYAHEDAWISREEAHARWLELGGNPSSPPQRLGWMRGKAKTFLARKGLSDVDGLFESRRVGGWYGTRIGLQPEQIVIV
ncbi:MAG: hypothetical protein AAGA48_08490 [Myxococcota bacterium]